MEAVEERHGANQRESDLAAFELQKYLLYLSSKRLLWKAQHSILVKSDLKAEIARNFQISSSPYTLRKTFLNDAISILERGEADSAQC